MNGLIFGALLALGMPQQTDTTFAVEGAQFLDVETLGGSIQISVWDEDRVRVQAEHSTRTFVEIERSRNGISVESEAERGPANLVDFRITVPRRMELRLEAQYGDIVIDGADGAVDAETLQGDVTIRGGRGTIEVSSTMGNILVDGADGRIEIESSAADIHVSNSSGEIFAETAGGTIVLENVDPTSVDVGSTGGRVYYAGSFRQGGTYFFGAHGGSITIVVPEGTAASFNVATVHGSITSNLTGEAQSLQSGERHQFTLGEGGALVEAETYGGRIRLVRAGTEGSEAPERRIREREALAPVALQGSLGDYHYQYDYDYEYDYEYEFDFDFDDDHELDERHEREITPGPVRVVAPVAVRLAVDGVPAVPVGVAPTPPPAVPGRLPATIRR